MKEQEAKAEEAPEQDAANAAPGKGKDKKDAKGKAPGKTPESDQNSPQEITVDYPTEVESDPDFLVFEKPKVEKPKEVATKGKQKKKELKLEDTYNVIRGSKFSLAVNFKLNEPEPVEEGEESGPEDLSSAI